MNFIIYSLVRQWLYERQHAVYFGYVEPVVSIVAVGLMLAGLFLLEAVVLGLALLAITYPALLAF